MVLVSPPQDASPAPAADIEARLATAMEKMSLKDAATVVAAETGQPRRDIYARAIALAAERRGKA